MERGCSTVPPMSSLTKISTHLYHLYVFPPCSFVWTHFACRRDLTLGYDDGLYGEAYPSRLAWFFRSSDRLKKSESKGVDTFECGNLNILVHSANNFVVLRG